MQQALIVKSSPAPRGKEVDLSRIIEVTRFLTLLQQ